MADRGFLRWVCLGVMIFATVVELPRAHGTSRNIYGQTEVGSICAGSVIPHGYRCQEFEVRTEDGYILSVQRIPDGGAAGGGSHLLNKQPVLFQHGLLVDGTTWFLNPPNQNLPFILADSGFDVWIANTRGTRFSRTHVSLDPNNHEFWNWSWDELVAYDLPATIDFVYQSTGQKIDYVGHSLVRVGSMLVSILLG
ncbi:hypothetical protein Nepgr_027537 [Nepenthes gracilis]|uniref:Partial AB-hydrolase lipase domain-containing protein n=1 Tax=Nepenthes gracilis TaxID=150966 RepID=A0AAD3Y376_NEPGR|nr:hypothetical protein Nepgr_027537 [Nepenthes gracilis]